MAVWFLLRGALRVWRHVGRAARAIGDGLCDKELVNVISDLQGYTDGHAFDSFKERKHERAWTRAGRDAFSEVSCVSVTALFPCLAARAGFGGRSQAHAPRQ